jgi:hypothetical protein
MAGPSPGGHVSRQKCGQAQKTNAIRVLAVLADFSVTMFVGDFCDHFCALTLIIAESLDQDSKSSWALLRR